MKAKSKPLYCPINLYDSVVCLLDQKSRKVKLYAAARVFGKEHYEVLGPPWSGKGQPRKVIAQAIGVRFDGVKMVYYTTVGLMPFTNDNCYRHQAHLFMGEELFKCGVCKRDDFTIGSVGARLIFNIGWVCGPCLDNLLDNDLISSFDLDENLERWYDGSFLR